MATVNSLKALSQTILAVIQLLQDTFFSLEMQISGAKVSFQEGKVLKLNGKQCSQSFG